MILIDTSFLVAAHNRRDVHHDPARDVMRRFLDGEWGRGLVLEYVFLELVTVLGARVGHGAAVEVADLLVDARELDLVACSSLFDETLRTFRSQREMRWSFTDSALVTVARQRGIRHLATFDEDFRGVAGLEVVP